MLGKHRTLPIRGQPGYRLGMPPQSVDRLETRIEELTVALEAAIDMIQALAMDLEAGPDLEEDERAKSIDAAITAGRAAKAVLGKR